MIAHVPEKHMAHVTSTHIALCWRECGRDHTQLQGSR